MRFLAPYILILTVFFAAKTEVSAAELLMFESDGCAWCERWHHDIGDGYGKTSEGKILPLRVVDNDMDDYEESYPGLRRVVFTPTFVVWKDGREVDRLIGYQGDEFFWPMLGQIIEKHGLTPGASVHAEQRPPGTCESSVC